MKYFVVGDVHGCFDQLKTLLNHWNPEQEKLIFLGDLVDRGKDSYKVVSLAMELKEKYGAKILRGNHEELFLDWINDPVESDFYYDLGGKETVNSFFDFNITNQKTAEYLTKFIQEKFPNEIEFLRSLPSYYETSDFIFVHAGVNPFISDWRNSNSNDFTWIRDPFIYGKNETGKIIIFGHTPTRNLNSNRSDDVWFSPCETKIGIDGGCCFNGSLHGLKIHEKQIDIFTVQ